MTGTKKNHSKSELKRMISDMTVNLSIKDAEIARLTELCQADYLTGLLNRKGLMHDLNIRIAAHNRHPNIAIAVFFIDLDELKRVNDTYGHEAGDEVLSTVARRLEGCARPDDAIARLGGDEFVLAMSFAHTRTGMEHCTAVAQRLLTEIGRAINVNSNVVGVSASIGCVYFHPESGAGHKHSIAEDLLDQADKAMYTVKHGTKNGCKLVDYH